MSVTSMYPNSVYLPSTSHLVPGDILASQASLGAAAPVGPTLSTQFPQDFSPPYISNKPTLSNNISNLSATFSSGDPSSYHFSSQSQFPSHLPDDPQSQIPSFNAQDVGSHIPGFSQLSHQAPSATSLSGSLNASLGSGLHSALSSPPGSMTTLAQLAASNSPLLTASLYIKNLPPEADKLFLYEKFAPYGGILSVKVLTESADSRRCRGVGFVNYVDHSSAMKAIQALHGTHIGENRTLHVTLQAPRSRQAMQ